MSSAVAQMASWQGNFAEFAEDCITVRTKGGSLARLKPNRAQRHILSAIIEQERRLGYVRAAVLKARQTGISTLFAARLFWHACTRDQGVQSLAFAHVDETAKKLATMVKTAYDAMPVPLRRAMHRSNEHEIAFGPSLLQFHTGGKTAGDRGRGSTLSVAWLSEVNFMEGAQQILTGAIRAVPDLPGTEVWLESTAKGGPTGPWYEFWCTTMRGENDFVGVFVPWHWSDEYTEPVGSGFTLSREAPMAGVLSEYDYAELHGLSNEQMMFRRKAIAGMGAMGAQGALHFSWEYPATPDEAFTGGESQGFIGAAEVERARQRQLMPSDFMGLPAVWGLDVAPPHGASSTALFKRRGPCGYSLERIRGLNLDELVRRIAEEFMRENPARLNVDASESYGMVVAERLSNMSGLHGRVKAVPFGGRADNPTKFKNKRAEMWFRVAQWLQGDVSIPDEAPVAGQASLMSELLAPRLRSDELLVQLESKQQMAARGVASPDGADALVLTFADMLDPVAVPAGLSLSPISLSEQPRVTMPHQTGAMRLSRSGDLW